MSAIATVARSCSQICSRISAASAATGSRQACRGIAAVRRSILTAPGLQRQQQQQWQTQWQQHMQHQCRAMSAFRRSAAACADKVMPLPSLGDSISEGTIVQWHKDEGDLIEAGDVLAVVETDKVSIDIRADTRGLLTKRHAAVDDKVNVGAPLYTLDAAAAPEPKQEPPPQRTPPPKPEDSAGFAAHIAGAFLEEEAKKHTPLIKFKGKRSKQKQSSQAATGAAKAASSSAAAAGHGSRGSEVKHSPNALDFDQIVGGAMFGRPGFTQEEIDAIESGGAAIAPKGTMKDVWMSA